MKDPFKSKRDLEDLSQHVLEMCVPQLTALFKDGHTATDEELVLVGLAALDRDTPGVLAVMSAEQIRNFGKAFVKNYDRVCRLSAEWEKRLNAEGHSLKDFE